jgi:tetratricopeptide (TPR) repeat protein
MDLAFYDYRILRRLFTKEQNVHISPIWIPYSITCKRCHDIDSYEISCRGYIELLAEALRRINASEKEQTYKSAFRPIQFDFFEQEMHPLAAFERCRQNIAKDPNDIDSRLTLAMLLFLIRDNKKAKDRLMECIKINPKELSPYLALTQVLEAEKNWHEACQWWLAIRHIIPKTNLDEQNKRKILQQCDDALARMGGTKYANVSPQHKVGRNDPCPCGSNKKYKKCCLTK